MRQDDPAVSELPTNDRPGDRWMCGRGRQPCSRGPGGDGNCPLQEACRPRKTWTGLRRQFVWSVVAIVAIGLLIASRPSVSSTVFTPGELSRPHAQILAGILTGQRCSACHAEASTSPSSWYAGGGNGHQDVSQTDRCLDCHHTSINRDLAKSAHNLPRHVRQQIRANLQLTSAKPRSWHDSLPAPAIAQDDIECSACHREHRGSDASLLDLSDKQCQTCHADRFGSFADSHPEWTQWPYGRGGTIAFDHRTHMNKHFPSTVSGGKAEVFDCTGCHRPNGEGELTRTVGYQQGCQSCHDDALRLEAVEGFDLFALPSLPSQAAEQVANWPRAASGLADGQLAPLMELLIRSQTPAAKSIVRIPNRDFSRIDSSEPEQVDAIVAIAEAHRRFLEEVSIAGHQSMLNRAAAAGLSAVVVAELFSTLSPQLLADAYQRWFDSAEQIDAPPSLPATQSDDDDDLLTGGEDLLLEEDLVGDDLLGGSDLNSATDPLSDLDSHESSQDAAATQRFEPSSMLPFGGWYRDDLRLSISYRGSGHSDPVLRAAINLISQLSISDPVRKRMLQSRAVTACVSCHPAAISAAASWRSVPILGRKSDFTKFAHKPHLNVSKLGDCLHCHRVAANHNAKQVNLVSTSSVQLEFEPLSRASCAACHTPKAAGDSCVQCHRYHIHR